MIINRTWALGAVLLSLSGVNWAQTTPTTPGANSLCSSPAYHPECNTAVTTQTVATTSFQQILSISQAVTQATSFSISPFGAPALASSGRSGIAAGTAAPAWNVWGSVSQNDNKLNDATFGFSGDTRTITLGGDLRLSPMLTAGLSTAFDEGSVDTANATAHLATRGFALAPYLAYQISKTLSVDGVIGFGQGSTYRTNTGGTSVRQGADRQFMGVNLNSMHWYGNLQLAGKVSLMSAEERSKNAVASNATAVAGATTRLTQARVGAQLGYWSNGIMPYASVTYVNDLGRTETSGLSLDRDGFVLAVGANLFSKSGLNGGVAFTSEIGRSSVKNDVFMANLNYRF